MAELNTNPFDQFDNNAVVSENGATANPFNQFDEVEAPTNPFDKFDNGKDTTEPNIYGAISQAETGPYENKWIRNNVTEESSAYGPAQLTYTLAGDFLDRKTDLFDENEQKYLFDFVQQGKDFINSNNPKDPVLGLGGSGRLTTDKDKKLYASVVTKMLNNIKEENKGDLEKTWNQWRFGRGGGVDDRYRKEFYNALNKTPEEVKPEKTLEQQISEFKGEAVQVSNLSDEPKVPVERAIIQKLASTVGTTMKDGAAKAITALTSFGDKPVSEADAKLIQENADKAYMARRQSGRSGFSPQGINQSNDKASLVVLNDLAEKLKESTPMSVRQEISEMASGDLLSTDVNQMVETWATMVLQQTDKMVLTAATSPAVSIPYMIAQEKEGFKEQVKSAAESAGVEIDEGALNERAEAVGLTNGLVEYVQTAINILPFKSIPKGVVKNFTNKITAKLAAKLPGWALPIIGIAKEASVSASEGAEEVVQGKNSRDNAIDFFAELDISDEDTEKAITALGGPESLREFTTGAGISLITRGIGKAASSNAVADAQTVQDFIVDETVKKQEKEATEFKEDLKTQVKEIKLHQKHMSNLLNREVSEEEAAKDWTTRAPNEMESLAELYRDRHVDKKEQLTTEQIREEKLTEEEKEIVGPTKERKKKEKEKEIEREESNIKKRETEKQVKDNKVKKEPLLPVKPKVLKTSEIVEKVSKKPVKDIKLVKPSDKSTVKKTELKQAPKEFEAISKEDQKKFTSLVNASDNVKMSRKALTEGILRVQVTVGDIKKVVELTPVDLKGPKVFRDAIQKSITEEDITTLQEGDVRVSEQAIADVKKTLVGKVKKSATNKDRIRIEGMEVQDFRAKLSKDLRLKSSIDLFTDNDIEVLQDIVADYGMGPLSTLNNKAINKIIGGDITSRKKSEIKAAELVKFNNPAVPVQYDELSDQGKKWVQTKVLRPSVKIKVPVESLQASDKFKDYMSKDVDKRDATIFSDLENSGEIKELVNNGSIEITVIPNNVPTKFAKEGPYTDRIKTLTEGAVITAKTVSLDDMQREKGIFEGSLENEDALEKGGQRLKYDVGTIDPDVSSSFGTFLDKRVGTTKQVKVSTDLGSVQGVLVPLEAMPDVVKNAINLSNEYRGSEIKMDINDAVRLSNTVGAVHTFSMEVAAGRLQNFDLTTVSNEEAFKIIENQRVLERYLEYVRPVVKQETKAEFDEKFKKQVNDLKWDTNNTATVQTARDIMFAIKDTLVEMQVDIQTSGSKFGSAYATSNRIIRMTQDPRWTVSFAHESGHYYYLNLLTADERATYSKEFIERFDSPEDVRNSLPFPDMAGTNLGYSPSEYFAEAFAQSLLQDNALKTTTKMQNNLFQKAIRWARNLWENISRRVQIDPVAKRYVDLSLSRKYDDMEHLAGYFSPEFNNVKVFSSMEFSQEDGIQWEVLNKKDQPKVVKDNQRLIMENALLADSVEKLPDAKTVKEAQNHFIDFVVYKMPIGPVRKNMLKTVASIKKIGDKNYIHAMEVVERYTELKNKSALVNEIKKLLNPKRLNKLNQQSRSTIDALMEKYSTKRLSAKKKLELVDLTSELANEDPKIASTSENIKLKREQVRLSQEPLAHLDIEKLEQIRDAIKQEVVKDRETKKAVKAGKKERIIERAEQLSERIDEIGSTESANLRGARDKIVQRTSRIATRSAKRSIEFFMNPETIANIMDGNENGVFYNNIIKPIQEGQIEGLKFKQASSDLIINLVKQTGVDITNWSYVQESGIANLGYAEEVSKDSFILEGGNSISLSKAEQVAFVRMARDEAGINHILGGGIVIGNSIVPTDITINDVSMMINTIDQDVYKVARAFDKYYEQEASYLNEFTMRTRGIDIATNPHYHPLSVQGLDRTKVESDFNSAEEIYNRVNRRSLTPSSEKSRVEGAKNAVYLEDMFVARARTAADAGFFVGMSSTIPEVQNTLNNVEKEMARKDLDQEFGILKKWIERVGQGDFNARVSPALSKVYGQMRKLYTAGALGYRLPTALIQEVSAFNYLTQVDDLKVKAELARKIPEFVAASNAQHLANLGNNQETTDKEMMDHDPFIRDRIESMTIDRDLNESGYDADARKDIQELATGRKTSRKIKGVTRVETGFKMIGFMDTVAIKAIWDTAKYEIGITTDLIPNSPAYWKAVSERANEVIRKTQPTFNALDKSEILNTPLLKEFTMFSSQRSKLANMAVRAVAKIQRGEVVAGLTDLAYVAVVVPTAVVSIKEIWKSLRDKDDDEKELKDYMATVAESFLSNFAIIGEALGSVLKDRRVRTSGIISGNIENISNFYQALTSDTWTQKKTFKKRMEYKDKKAEQIKKHGIRLLQGFGYPSALHDYPEVFENIIGGEDDN